MKERRGASADFRPVAWAPGGAGEKEWRSVLEIYGGFPINTDKPREALRSVLSAKEAVLKGGVVVIFPEGETYTGLTKPKRGMAKIASPGIPIVPVGFLQDEQPGGSFVYKVRFGEKIVPGEEDLASKSGQVLLLDKVMVGIADLLPGSMRGEYFTDERE